MQKRIFFRIPEYILNMHVHGRSFTQRHKATVLQILTQARLGLINTLGYMPNTQPPITSIPMLQAYKNLIAHAKKKLQVAHKQYVWFGVTDYDLLECKLALQDEDVIGLKIYPKAEDGSTITTGTIGVICDKTILEAMKLGAKYNKPIAIHGDDPVIIAACKGNPIKAEVSYDKKVLQIANLVPGVKIYFCHVSCRDSAELILRAQTAGITAVIELCSHYLWFDNSGTNWAPGLNPAFYKCFNCLRSPEHRQFLINLLQKDNPLIIVSTDDAWHTKKEKLSVNPPGGFPSVRQMVPAMVTLAVQHKISEARVAQLLSFNASEFFEIPVPKKLVEYEWELQPDETDYNNGMVENPWKGSRLYFPIL